jgi:hypothetical protein
VDLLRPVERDREPTGPVTRRLIVRDVHDGEPPEMFLGLDVGTVREDRLPVSGLDAAHRRRCVDTPIGEDENTGVLHLLDHRHAGFALLAQLLQRVGR